MSKLYTYIINRKRKPRLLFPGYSLLILAIYIMVSVSGCCTASYHLNDDELLPFAAMHQVDREKFCLTEIDAESRVEIHKTSLYEDYDVRLAIYGDRVDHEVFFVEQNGQYIWIGETETHYSGHKFDSVDGKIREHIVIFYKDRAMKTGREGLSILYHGDNENIPLFLSCEQALSIIEKWNSEAD